MTRFFRRPILGTPHFVYSILDERYRIVRRQASMPDGIEIAPGNYPDLTRETRAPNAAAPVHRSHLISRNKRPIPKFSELEEASDATR